MKERAKLLQNINIIMSTLYTAVTRVSNSSEIE